MDDPCAGRRGCAVIQIATAWRNFAFGIGLLLLGGNAGAENHALIMWIGEYKDANANLPGLENDARNARRIAAAMGVPNGNITELKNAQLTFAGMSGAIRGLTDRIRTDDRVFIYYSGHGAQVESRQGSTRPCSEGIVAQDVQLYYDAELEADLTRLASKASQVVMLNDSCFSGGAATKGIDKTRGVTGRVPKFLPLKLSAPAQAAATPRQCGDAINKSQTITRNLEVIPASGAQLLYIAAAGENEVAYATDSGSPATQAWADCAVSGEADVNRSGSISGEELRACAQARLAREQPNRQTITVRFNSALLMSFAPGAASAPTSAVDASKALADLRAASDPNYKVVLELRGPHKDELRIGTDFLDFSVRSNRAGYLYVLQVGSDGKTFNQLFPNKIDADNRIGIETPLDLPRSNWRVRAGGPTGNSYLLAIVAPEQRNFVRTMDTQSTIPHAPTTGYVTRTLQVEAANGRYGTSEVVRIREIP